MTEQNKQQDFLAAAKATLDAGIENLDSHTLSDLRQRREQALSRKKSSIFWSSPYPALAATAAVLVVTVSILLNPVTTQNEIPVLEDLPMLTTVEELDFYQELDFYDWLENEKLKS